MKIYGLQKMTLLDYPGHVACTVFLGGCDFRCPFCHNFELVTGGGETVDESDLFGFLESRKGMLDGVAVTGGEPCLQADLPAFISDMKGMGYKVKLDTNGYHPIMLDEVIRSGCVDYVAMDVKNSPEKYAMTVGREIDLDKIRMSIAILIDSGVDYEFRTTVVDELHRPGDFDGIGQMIQGAKRHFIQAFTDRDTVPYGNLHAPDKTKLRQCQAVMSKYVHKVRIRGL